MYYFHKIIKVDFLLFNVCKFKSAQKLLQKVIVRKTYHFWILCEFWKTRNCITAINFANSFSIFNIIASFKFTSFQPTKIHQLLSLVNTKITSSKLFVKHATFCEQWQQTWFPSTDWFIRINTPTKNMNIVTSSYQRSICGVCFLFLRFFLRNCFLICEFSLAKYKSVFLYVLIVIFIQIVYLLVSKYLLICYKHFASILSFTVWFQNNIWWLKRNGAILALHNRPAGSTIWFIHQVCCCVFVSNISVFFKIRFNLFDVAMLVWQIKVIESLVCFLFETTIYFSHFFRTQHSDVSP
jgi:hypothetical protein